MHAGRCPDGNRKGVFNLPPLRQMPVLNGLVKTSGFFAQEILKAIQLASIVLPIVIFDVT
jgi:hypothetical protein